MAGLSDRRIAVLATDGVEQMELTEPVKALRAASAQVAVIAPKGGRIQGMNHDQMGDTLPVDHDLASVSPDQFDALVKNLRGIGALVGRTMYEPQSSATVEAK